MACRPRSRRAPGSAHASHRRADRSPVRCTPDSADTGASTRAPGAPTKRGGARSGSPRHGPCHRAGALSVASRDSGTTPSGAAHDARTTVREYRRDAGTDLDLALRQPACEGPSPHSTARVVGGQHACRARRELRIICPQAACRVCRDLILRQTSSDLAKTGRSEEWQRRHPSSDPPRAPSRRPRRPPRCPPSLPKPQTYVRRWSASPGARAACASRSIPAIPVWGAGRA